MTILFSPSALGFYDAEDHPSPPGDCLVITAADHQALLNGQSQGRVIRVGAGGQPVLVDRPAPSNEELQSVLTAAVQRHLDGKAIAMGYDSLASAASYADEPAVIQFQTEGRALRAWRSRVWAACIEVLAAVTAGTRPVPTADELLASLPPFTS